MVAPREPLNLFNSLENIVHKSKLNFSSVCPFKWPEEILFKKAVKATTMAQPVPQRRSSTRRSTLASLDRQGYS